MSGLLFVADLLSKYLVPLIFVVGLMYFIYGCIEYFIIGSGDAGRAQRGREMLLKSIAWFSIAVLIYLVVWFLTWLGSFSLSSGYPSSSGDVNADVRQNEAILQVPNVPTR